MKNHKQLPITILSLCVVIGAIVFSEFTPAIPFESGSLREASMEGLIRITGRATVDKEEPKGCHCKGELCDEIGNEHCVWVGNLDPEKPCTGCEGAELLTARFGDDLVCYSGDTPNSEVWFGCCADECKDLGCPKACEPTYIRKVGVGDSAYYRTGCEPIACYEEVTNP